MKKYLAVSILLLCLLNLGWRANLLERASAASDSALATPTFTKQQINLTVVPQTQKPVKTPHITPTHTPRPTSLPPEIPPPTDRRLLHSMILFAVIASLTVVIGLWINRRRINPR
jgi:hypothetical protein